MPTNEERYFNSSQKKYDDPTWIWQKDEHAGTFSVDNPYLNNLNQAIQHSDVDALYELAVKEEAKLADYRRERADKYADLQEQRAYDDPMAQVARQRRAGINPDLAGASGGASVGSGSSATAQMPTLQSATENTSQFSNASQRSQLLLNGVQSATSILGAVSSLGQSIIGGFQTLKMLPIQKTAGELANQAQSIANANGTSDLLRNTISDVIQLGEFITPDLDDEQGVSLIGSLGFADKAEQYLPLIRQMHSNPEFKAKFLKSQQDQLEQEEYNKVYNREVISRTLSMAQQIKDSEQSFDLSTKHLEASVASILDTSEYASDLATLSQMTTNNALDSSTVESKQLDLANQHIDRALEVYEKQLEHCKEAIETSRELIDRVYKKVKASGRKYLSSAEQAIVDVEQEKIVAYETMGAEYMHNVHSMVLETYKSKYFLYNMMHGHNGQVGEYALHPDIVNFMNSKFTFGDISAGTISPAEATNEIKGGLKSLIKFLVSKGKFK